MDGDEDEDEFDDLEHEFDYNEYEQHIAGAAFSSRGIGRTTSGITTHSEMDPAAVNSEIPLLTYGQEVVVTYIVFLDLCISVSKN